MQDEVLKPNTIAARHKAWALVLAYWVPIPLKAWMFILSVCCPVTCSSRYSPCFGLIPAQGVLPNVEVICNFRSDSELAQAMRPNP
jgi:hypothetical protein